MKILKYKKKKNGIYQITFDDESKVELYEDIILKYNLLIKKEIDKKLYKEILEDNKNYGSYHIALAYIKKKLRTIFEVKEYLLKKEYKENVINASMDKLIKEGYLDDNRYASAYINDSIKFSNKGIEVIKKELIGKKVSIDIIEECIEKVDNDILFNKLEKMINKTISTNHKYSGNQLKQNIVNKFVKLGYSKTMINNMLSTIEIKEDKMLLEKEYLKLYNKYKNKYDKNKLDITIKQKLYQKGFSIESINNILNSQ